MGYTKADGSLIYLCPKLPNILAQQSPVGTLFSDSKRQPLNGLSPVGTVYQIGPIETPFYMKTDLCLTIIVL